MNNEEPQMPSMNTEEPQMPSMNNEERMDEGENERKDEETSQKNYWKSFLNLSLSSLFLWKM
jgi:hypothetical protein